MSLKVVVPARYASTRLPGKPLKLIGDRPMVVHVVDRVKRALPEAEVIVATDHDAIVSALIESVDVEMTSTEHESGTDRIAEVASKRGWADSDVVVNVQGDEPLIPVGLLREFPTVLLDGVHEMATVCTPFTSSEELENPNAVKVVLDHEQCALYFSRASIPFDRDQGDARLRMDNSFRHIGIYAYTVRTLNRVTAAPQCALERIEKLEQLRALHLGIKIKVARWEHEIPHGVDTAADLKRARQILGGVS